MSHPIRIVRNSLAMGTSPLPARGTPARDQYRRPLRDLRISITDKCNFRCTYCMPREIFGADYPFLPHGDLLSFEEIARVARIGTRLGLRKLRLTGGEPLLRKDIEVLIGLLSPLKTLEGNPIEIALTTNGTLLAQKAQALKDAGLERVTVSLDALDGERFQHMSDSKVAVERVLEGIEQAAAVGLQPVKVNMVVRKGLNDDQIVPMAEYFRTRGHILRFIEYMDVGNTNGWNLSEVLTGQEILARLQAHYKLEPVAAEYRGEVASRYRYTDGQGEIGLITSVSQPFCGDCTRLRLSPEGKFFLCLFGSQGYDVRALLRAGATDDEVAQFINNMWARRDNRYSEQRGEQSGDQPKVEMSYIGG